jgi:putative ABC transport system permease protein
MHNLLQDLRFAIRQLRKSPGFALTTMLTLALGIGATTAMFSLINSVLLRPLPFPDPDRLMMIAPLDTSTVKSGIPDSMSYPGFFDFRKGQHSFDAIASYHRETHSLTGSGMPQEIESETVSSDFFRVLGVAPMLGRSFISDDEKKGTRVAVLNYQFWQSTFGGAPDIIGRNITLDRNSYTVVGVMPAGFTYPLLNPNPSMWTSLADDNNDPKEPLTSQRGALLLSAIGRLKPGVSAAQATADLSLIAKNLSMQYPDTNKNVTSATVEPELENLVGDTRPALHVLFAAVMFLLLIACANVAGLMLTRASRRRSEIAVRAAMGASRGEIIRQVLVESVFLSLCGGALGVVLSELLLKTILRLVPQNLPRLNYVSIDGKVLLFAALVSIVTGVLFGVIPAWRMSRLDPSLALRDGTRTMTSGRGQHRLHNILVVAETAIGLVLLIGAGLLIHSFIRVLNVDPGFDPHNVLTASIDLPDNQYPTLKEAQFQEDLLSRLATLPGVEAVSSGYPLPLSRHNIGIGFTVEGHPVAKGDEPAAPVTIVTPGFFRTMRIPLLAGRDFLPSDDSKAQAVTIVDEAFAKKYFPGENPIGRHIKPGLGDGVTDSPDREIIGVVGSVKRKGLTSEIVEQFYLPQKQAIIVSPAIVLRTTGDPMSLLGPLRAELGQMDNNIPLYRINTLEDFVSLSASQPRFQTVLITFFAVMALLLSAIGLYAVLSYMVAQRTLEIGLRLALGAQRESVVALILRRGLGLAAIGLAIGVVASLVLTRFMAELLYGVKPLDPLTFVAVSVVLMLVSAIASSAPAYRAARLDPMRTLREQ